MHMLRSAKHVVAELGTRPLMLRLKDATPSTTCDSK